MEAFNDYTYRFLETIEKLELTDYKVWNTLENLSKATMSKIRRGICGVSMNTLQEFCQTYKVNANYILTGKGEMFLSEDNKPVDNLSTSQSQDLYESIIIGKDKEIEELKNEINRLIGENSIMREQLGIGKRKPSTKSA